MIVAILALILALISPVNSTGADVTIIAAITPKSVESEEDKFWCAEYDHAEACFDRLFNNLSYTRKGDYAIMRREGQSKFIYCKKAA